MPVAQVSMQVLKRGTQPTKTVILSEGATVADILKEVSTQKNVPETSLFVTKMTFEDCVKLHKNEIPDTDIQLGGVEDLEGLADVLYVEPPLKRTYLSTAEALQFQDELIAAYSEEFFQKTLKKFQDRFISGQVDIKKYSRMLPDVLKPAQKKVFPKWDFEVTQKGIALTQECFEPFLDEENPEPEVVEKTNIINSVLGLDFAWVPPQGN